MRLVARANWSSLSWIEMTITEGQRAASFLLSLLCLNLLCQAWLFSISWETTRQDNKRSKQDAHRINSVQLVDQLHSGLKGYVLQCTVTASTVVTKGWWDNLDGIWTPKQVTVGRSRWVQKLKGYGRRKSKETAGDHCCTTERDKKKREASFNKRQRFSLGLYKDQNVGSNLVRRLMAIQSISAGLYHD